MGGGAEPKSRPSRLAFHHRQCPHETETFVSKDSCLTEYYDEYGYEFGTAPDRLRALGRALPQIKQRLERLNPPPLRQPLPILIGGGGEKVTLKLTAQHATMWNGFGPPETYRHKNQVLDSWCREIGRDPADIERTVSISVGDLDRLDAFVDAGATHIILGIGEPWNFAAVERLVTYRDRS